MHVHILWRWVDMQDIAPRLNFPLAVGSPIILFTRRNRRWISDGSPRGSKHSTS